MAERTFDTGGIPIKVTAPRSRTQSREVSIVSRFYTDPFLHITFSRVRCWRLSRGRYKVHPDLCVPRLRSGLRRTQMRSPAGEGGLTARVAPPALSATIIGIYFWPSSRRIISPAASSAISSPRAKTKAERDLITDSRKTPWDLFCYSRKLSPGTLLKPSATTAPRKHSSDQEIWARPRSA